jgi:elongation factor Ts
VLISLFRRQDRSTTQGLIGIKVADNAQTAVMIQLNCETDFVAKTEIFKDGALTFLESVANAKDFSAKLSDVGDASVVKKFMSNKLTKSLDPDLSSMTGEEGITHLINKTRENCTLGKVIKQSVEGNMKFGNYLHGGPINSNLGKIGTLVLLSSENSDPNIELHPIANVIAMHVTAMVPKYINKESVPSDAKHIKNDHILELQELVSPDNVDNYTVRDYLNKVGDEMGTKIAIEDFAIFTTL